MVGLESREREVSSKHVVIGNVDELKGAVMWGVYRALWLWLLTWLAVGLVVGLVVLVIGGKARSLLGVNSLEDAYVAAMKSDLRNLVTAEEAVFADSVKYLPIVEGRIGWLRFTVTEGNSMPIVTVTSDGWTATITNAHTAKQCAIFIGSTSIPPTTYEGTRCLLPT